MPPTPAVRSRASSLFPYQQEGVRLMKAANFRVLLADDPGLGKTAQVLAAIRENPQQLLPALVICPTSVVQNWVRECMTWLKGVNVQIAVLQGVSDELPEDFQGIVIVGWAILEDYAKVLKKWGPRLVVADEAHLAKDHNSGRSEVFFRLGRRAPHVIPLTGTPLVNIPDDVWNLLDIVKSGCLGERVEFRKLCRDDPEAAQKLMAPHVIRREFEPTIREIGKTNPSFIVPPRTRIVVNVEERLLPRGFRAEYKRADEEFTAWLRDTVPARLAAEYRRRKMDPKVVSEQFKRDLEGVIRRAAEYEHLVKTGRLRQLVGEAKVPAVMHWLLPHVQRREGVVIFAEHQGVFELMEKALRGASVRFATIYGSNSSDSGSAVDAFQSGRVSVLLSSRAGCQGLTLTRSCFLGLMERYWTAMHEEQAESRIWRLTQKRPCTIVRFQIPGTYDVRMDEIVKAKSALSSGLMNVAGETE